MKPGRASVGEEEGGGARRGRRGAGRLSRAATSIYQALSLSPLTTRPNSHSNSERGIQRRAAVAVGREVVGVASAATAWAWDLGRRSRYRASEALEGPRADDGSGPVPPGLPGHSRGGLRARTPPTEGEGTGCWSTGQPPVCGRPVMPGTGQGAAAPGRGGAAELPLPPRRA